MLKARVMVVEDEAIVALAIEKCLQNLGHEVPAKAESGEEAVQKAIELDPDLILMDIRLKGSIDGIEAAHRINHSLKIPIIYLTAYSDDETLLRARVTEPYGYILKPFDEKLLKATIEMTLYKSVMQASLRRSKQQLSTILNSIGEAVIVADMKGEITYVNQAAEMLTGYPSQKALGSILGQIFQIFEAGTGAPALLPITRVILQGETLNLKGFILLTKDGGCRPVTLHLAPIHNEVGNVTGIAVAFHEEENL